MGSSAARHPKPPQCGWKGGQEQHRAHPISPPGTSSPAFTPNTTPRTSSSTQPPCSASFCPSCPSSTACGSSASTSTEPRHFQRRGRDGEGTPGQHDARHWLESRGEEGWARGRDWLWLLARFLRFKGAPRFGEEGSAGEWRRASSRAAGPHPLQAALHVTALEAPARGEVLRSGTSCPPTPPSSSRFVRFHHNKELAATGAAPWRWERPRPTPPARPPHIDQPDSFKPYFLI